MTKHDKDNFTPLLIAACHGHTETIECLLQEGATLSDIDKNDKSAIYWAAAENKVDALKVCNIIYTSCALNGDEH